MGEVASDTAARGVEPQVVGTAIAGGLRMRSFGIERELDATVVNDSESMLGLLGSVSTDTRWSFLLMLVSGTDLILSGTFLCVAFSYAYRDVGMSLVCLGLQMLSHLVSSLLLVLRMLVDLLPAREADAAPCASAVSDEYLLRVQRRRDLARERCLSMFMGFVMLGLSLVLSIAAYRKIRLWGAWYSSHDEMDRDIAKTTNILAWSGFTIYLVQAIFRFLAGRRLHNRIIWNGLAISIVSVIFFQVLAVAAFYEAEWSWKAEPIAAIILAAFLLFEGVRLLCTHRFDIDVQLSQETYV